MVSKLDIASRGQEASIKKAPLLNCSVGYYSKRSAGVEPCQRLPFRRCGTRLCSPRPGAPTGCLVAPGMRRPEVTAAVGPSRARHQVIPPRPAPRASTAIHSLRCRSSSTGANSENLRGEHRLAVGGLR